MKDMGIYKFTNLECFAFKLTNLEGYKGKPIGWKTIIYL